MSTTIYGKSCQRLIYLADRYLQYVVSRERRLELKGSKEFHEAHVALSRMLADKGMPSHLAWSYAEEFLCRSEMPQTLTEVLEWMDSAINHVRTL